MLLWQLADHRGTVHLARLQPDGQPPQIGDQFLASIENKAHRREATRDACFCSRAKGGVLRRAHWRPPWTSSSHLDRTVQHYCFRMLGAASQPSAMGAAGFEPATSRV